MASGNDREYFRVPNWDTLQARRDKNLPWCKLYAEMLDSEEWTSLTSHLKASLVEIWMMAAKHANRIPAELAFRQTKARRQDIRLLIESGLVEQFVEAFEPQGFRDLARKPSDKHPSKTRDSDLSDSKDRPRQVVNKGRGHVGNVVAGLSLSKSSGPGLAFKPPPASTKMQPGGMEPHEWERLNHRVKELVAAGTPISALERVLANRYTKNQISQSLRVCRDRGWIR